MRRLVLIALLVCASCASGSDSGRALECAGSSRCAPSVAPAPACSGNAFTVDGCATSELGSAIARGFGCQECRFDASGATFAFGGGPAFPDDPQAIRIDGRERSFEACGCGSAILSSATDELVLDEISYCGHALRFRIDGEAVTCRSCWAGPVHPDCAAP